MISQVQVALGNAIVNLGVSVREHYDHTLEPMTGVDFKGTPTALHKRDSQDTIPVLWYTVSDKMLVYVKVKFDGMHGTMNVSYINEDNTEDSPDVIEFDDHETHKFPFPTQKNTGDGKDGWVLRYLGTVVMKIYFEID
jgi:hypothetical protein